MRIRPRKRTVWILIVVGAAALVIANTQLFQDRSPNDPLLVNDVSWLNATRVAEVVHAKTEQDLIDAVRRARERERQISIAGSRHSQGGHVMRTNSIHVDMTGFNEILSLDSEEKTIRVQSGVTWQQIQDYINPHKLSVKVMQSSNVFTVGGSLSANVHGRDPRFGPIIETVRSFRLLTPTAKIINVSRTENEDLFGLVIGGFGLFGIIIDVKLELTDDTAYTKRTVQLPYDEYAAYFEEHVQDDNTAGLHYGRLSIAPDSMLRDAYAVTYTVTEATDQSVFNLQKEKNVRRDKFFFGLSRRWNWAKTMRWELQQSVIDDPSDNPVISRNNAMRPPIAFLEHYDSNNTDILQEYFIPIDRFEDFVDELRDIVDQFNINLLSVTVRYIPQNDEAVLSYVRNDCFAVVLYINQERSQEGRRQAEQWTRQLVDAAHECDGTYYLVYQRYPTKDQLLRSYPDFNDFVAVKRKRDPQMLFVNEFFSHYTSTNLVEK